MTRLLVIAIVVAVCSTFGRADEHVSAFEKLAHFTLTGCEYLKANAWDPPVRRLGSDEKQAEHFGRILKKERRGLALNYHLRSTDFPTWDVSYWNHGLELRPPSEAQLLLAELEGLFGPADVPDEDNARSANVDLKAPGRSERLEFARPPEHPLCRITATVERSDGKGSRRVLLVRFSD